jgi:DNA-binding transcriptional regulator YiaG
MQGKELKQRRAALGLTQVALAEAMGVGWSAVARWEIDENKIPKWAEILLGFIEREMIRPVRRARVARKSTQPGKRRAK